MFAVALFLYTWHQTRGRESVRRWPLLGATAGLMSLVRWQNVLFVVFPAADAIVGLSRSFGAGRHAPANETTSETTPDDNGPAAGHLTPHLVRYAAFAGAFIVVFSPQMVFWKVVRGGFFAMPAAAHDTAWLSPQLADVLFSPDRGLFSWTPLLLLASIGLLFFARRQPYFGSLLIAALALQIYINSTVGWGGHGFGARRFTNCALIFAIGLAALLQWLRSRPALVPALLLAAFVLVNGFAMLGMQTGTLPPSGAIRSLEMLAATTSRIGNPYALPMNAWIALRYDADLGLYERLGPQSSTTSTSTSAKPTTTVSWCVASASRSKAASSRSAGASATRRTSSHRCARPSTTFSSSVWRRSARATSKPIRSSSTSGSTTPWSRACH